MSKLPSIVAMLFIAIFACPLNAFSDTQARKLVIAECESLEEVSSRIESCSENSKAVASAKRCYSEVLKRWEMAKPELEKISSLAASRSHTRQNAEMAFSQSDYEKAIRQVETLLEETDEKAQLLSSYSTGMLRDYDIEELTGPMECYAGNFEELKKIVWSLDDRYDEGERALAEALRLRNVALNRDQSLNNSVGAPTVSIHYAQGAVTRAPASVPYRPNPASRPDITGTRESAEKEILGQFVLRGQLTGNR